MKTGCENLNEQLSLLLCEFLKSQLNLTNFFQADHALYTPGLDENRVSREIVHGIWIYYKVQFPKFCTLQLKPEVQFP